MTHPAGPENMTAGAGTDAGADAPEAAATADAITVTSPTTGAVLGTVPAHTQEDTQAAFARARAAQPAWAALPVARRREILLRYHDLVLDRQDELLDLIQDESGKSRMSAFEEVMDVAITARHCAYAAGRLLRERSAGIRGAALPLLTRTRIQREPVGVVGIIAPWNYPLTLAVSDGLAALAMGNTAVLKPDSQTPLTALKALDLLYEAGVPRDVFIPVTGRGTVVGQAIAQHCDFLMFTGSSATGAELAATAGRRLIGYSAELGGKNPLIIAPDADLARTVPGAISACFANTGQLCISIERIYVHAEVAAEFTQQFVAATKALRIGPGREWTTAVGSLISAEHARHVDELVRDAIDSGARVLTGARPLPQLGEAFYAPTVLTDVPATARLHREEVFGPVVYIQAVATIDEAIAHANDTDYGLNASVWAAPATGRAIAAQLQAGTVNINEGFAAAWASTGAPMGGWKRSGQGRRHGDAGLLKYTETRTVAQQRLIPITNLTGTGAAAQARTMTSLLKAGKRILR